MKKELTPYGVGSFSFYLQRSSPKSSLTERSTYLVRISAPAPCGRNRGPISPGRVRSATPYFSDCPDQCAALYLVRIFSAARCAGFSVAEIGNRKERLRVREAGASAAGRGQRPYASFPDDFDLSPLNPLRTPLPPLKRAGTPCTRERELRPERFRPAGRVRKFGLRWGNGGIIARWASSWKTEIFTYQKRLYFLNGTRRKRE